MTEHPGEQTHGHAKCHPFFLLASLNGKANSPFLFLFLLCFYPPRNPSKAKSTLLFFFPHQTALFSYFFKRNPWPLKQSLSPLRHKQIDPLFSLLLVKSPNLPLFLFLFNTLRDSQSPTPKPLLLKPFIAGHEVQG